MTKRLVRVKVIREAIIEAVWDDDDREPTDRALPLTMLARDYAQIRVATEPSLVELKRTEESDWLIIDERVIGTTAPDQPVIAYRVRLSGEIQHPEQWWVPVVAYPHTHRDDQRYLAIETCRALAEQVLGTAYPPIVSLPCHIELSDRLHLIRNRYHWLLPNTTTQDCWRGTMPAENISPTLDAAFAAAVTFIARLRAGEDLLPALEDTMDSELARRRVAMQPGDDPQARDQIQHPDGSHWEQYRAHGLDGTYDGLPIPCDTCHQPIGPTGWFMPYGDGTLCDPCLRTEVSSHGAE